MQNKDVESKSLNIFPSKPRILCDLKHITYKIRLSEKAVWRYFEKFAILAA